MTRPAGPHQPTAAPAARSASEDPAPLPFHDPVDDGATDPAVIRDRATGEWVMLYTQRHPSSVRPGVSWVHGSRIGAARSADGVRWAYVGVLDGLDTDADGPGPHTHWAPEVIWDGERYRMYLTHIRGIPEQWAGHARRIRELVSDDLREWRFVRDLELSRDRVIDACVARCPDGLWRLWWKDEADGSTSWVASTGDLDGDWHVDGQAVGGRAHEGSNVFSLAGYWWMLTDEWRGMAVWRSADAVTWERQGGPDAVVLGTPGAHPEDRTVGRHGDVVVEGDEATLFYFTHPWWDGTEIEDAPGHDSRLSAVHAARLTVIDGVLTCERGRAGGSFEGLGKVTV
ncbi:hypothetical protein [uncultured Demequina sp.]|uniref:hypothetical protein n=1 Tax=uncultured Demequina sp. TaxID=693499 RepID=UPI0025D63B18|nr:hypothetical protein [uncultured Demequina sp.]